MIFVDTSAIVSILLSETGAHALSDRIERARERYTAGHCKLETCMVLSSRLDLKAGLVLETVNEFIIRNSIKVLDLTDSVSETAVRAFELYGKGQRNKAQLNLADCMSYAFAKSHKLDILFTGLDFTHTDLKAA